MLGLAHVVSGEAKPRGLAFTPEGLCQGVRVLPLGQESLPGLGRPERKRRVSLGSGGHALCASALSVVIQEGWDQIGGSAAYADQSWPKPAS